MIKDTNKRLQVTLTQENNELLEKVAARTGKTKSTLINETIKNSLSGTLAFLERYDKTLEEREREIIEEYGLCIHKIENPYATDEVKKYAAMLIEKVFEKLAKNNLLTNEIDMTGFGPEMQKTYGKSPYVAEVTVKDIPELAETFDEHDQIMKEIMTYSLRYNKGTISSNGILFSSLGSSEIQKRWFFKVAPFYEDFDIKGNTAGETICRIIAKEIKKYY